VIEVGPAYESCRAAARVARDFETLRRRDLLSFQHHLEVAALPPDEANAMLDWWGLRHFPCTKFARKLSNI
jgi:hypothetical protein